MMFGYACRDTEEYMPLPLALAHQALLMLAKIRKQQPELMPYLRPDSKSQFTIEYDGDTNEPVRVHTIVISTQHDEFTPATLGNMSYADGCAQYGQKRVDEEMQKKIRASIPGTPRVQLVVGDGLSSAAITANAMDCLEAIREGLKLKGIDPGKPIFVRYCRVGAGDAIGDVTGCELVCMLVGERPGLVTDKSMSAYITYMPRTGVSESARTVVSNIHAQGTPAVEAGAHIAGLIETILRRKVSGVGLVNGA
jgi:hypothetical protein